MDPLTTLYERLRRQHAVENDQAWPAEPPHLEEWLGFWNDDDTALGNLRHFEHWLSRRRQRPAAAPRIGRIGAPFERTR